MATVTIPFPSTESLLGPEIAAIAASPTKASVKSPTKKPPAFKKHFTQPKNLNGVAKPKQTKSRNGCHTCKEKRLKCDETKPKCDQCKKRNVECGGYNKIFQWRPEEKATFRAGPTPKNRRKSSNADACDPSPTTSIVPNAEQVNQSLVETSPTLDSDVFVFDPQLDHQSHALDNSEPMFDDDTVPLEPSVARYVSEVLKSSACTIPDDEEREYLNDQDDETADRAISSVEENFSFDDTFLPSETLDLSRESPEFLPYPYQDYDLLDSFTDEVIEEVEGNGRLPKQWPLVYPSPSPSELSFPQSSLLNLKALHKTPGFNPFSTEMLIARFASETCGILSIKDGQHENPWRTMLLPMSFGVPALHHAILALSAFHASRDFPSFRIPGLKHMQKSIQYLGNQLGVLRRDTALATTLVLGFSECWNEETSTGIRHLKAARTLVTQAIANNNDNADIEELERLKFLRNTWIYMDVIARITAAECDDSCNIDSLFAPVYGPQSQDEDLDPLMGCASGLFPLIGDVANLVREIRKLKGNSPRIVSRAADLKAQILKWRAPVHLRIPQDESIEVSHALNTAEAYRWSAILFLFQSVPMIATEPSAVLAERILYHLVAVPLSSRVIIIQIFPLLVAGCELTSDENRTLVKDRWRSMTNRMAIGNLDRCLDVVVEVWARRDNVMQHARDRSSPGVMQDVAADELSFPLKQGNRLSSTSNCPSVVRPDQLYRRSSDADFDIDQMMNLRGYGHWLTVMEDWDWAVLLG